MVQINFTGKEILTKVVYYGPARCGKTTNLQLLHRMTDPDRKTKLFSINTDQDRTLFFDLLPLSLGRIHGYRVKLQIYTVPGQVQYASTRRAVLAGADAVVFVADSERGKMDENIESLKDLGVNLPYNRLDIATLPMVLQYNKRDLSDVYTVVEMEEALNSSHVPHFESVAINGRGVLDTFISVSRKMINSVVAKYRLDRGMKGQVDFGSRLSRALEEFRQQESEDTNPIDMSSLQLKFDLPAAQKKPDVGLPTPDEDDSLKPMSNADLIERAVSANMELANLYVRLDETKRELDGRIKQLEAVNRIGESVTSILEIDRLLSVLVKILGEHKGDCICVALVEGRPAELRPRATYRLKTDPVFLVRAERGKSLAHLLAHQRQPSVVTLDSHAEWFRLIKARFPTVEGLISLPLMSHRRLLGLVNIITTESKRGFDESDVKFYRATGQFLASAIENARLYGMVSNLNRGLEKKFEEIKTLNQEFEHKINDRTHELQLANRALKRANDDFRMLDQTKDEFMSMVSQELRNPLQLLSTELSAIAQAGNVKDVKRRVGALEDHANDLENTVSDLVHIFNIEQGKLVIDFHDVSLQEIIRKALYHHRRLVREKKIKVLTRLNHGLHVKASLEWMVEVFGHLIHNAAKFAPQESDIKIWTDFRNGNALIYIRDQGPGIAAERRGQVFNKYQIINGEAYVETGLGLGLPISKGIVDLHHGRIELLDPPAVKGKPSQGLLVRIVMPGFLMETAPGAGR